MINIHLVGSKCSASRSIEVTLRNQSEHFEWDLSVRRRERFVQFPYIAVRKSNLQGGPVLSNMLRLAGFGNRDYVGLAKQPGQSHLRRGSIMPRGNRSDLGVA